MNRHKPDGRKKRAQNKKKAKAKAAAERTEALPSDPQPMMPFMEGPVEDILDDSELGGFEMGETSAVRQAQMIMYDAFEAPTRQKAMKLAWEALAVSPDCADAYNLLAEAEEASRPEAALDLYRKGVAAGERALGEEAFTADVGHFWGLLETRPYMRAREGVAQRLWSLGAREESVAHYWDMLRLNPNDNQGIRYALMPALIELGCDQDAERLFGLYPDDCMAVWAYSRALLDFRRLGDSSATQKALKMAIEVNPHIPALLLGRKKMPRTMPEYCGFGDENEAVLYVDGGMAAWQGTSGALEWLAAKAK